jgi:curved DNA-binding protein CbpA
MAESFYKLLGITPDAEEADIRRAYREQLKETHPDVNDAPDADDRTRRLLAAKETLLDVEKRARYDRLGHQAYVSETGVATATASQERASTGPREPDWTDRTADAGTGPTNARAGPWERRDHERRAADRVETDPPEAEAGPASRDRTAEASDPWAESRVDVSVDPDDVVTRGAWLSIGESPVLALATVVLYPIFLGASVFPPFPLWVNLLVAGCTVGLVAALQAMPGVGVLVFAIWSVVGAGALAAGVAPLGVLGPIVALGAWFPLGLTLLTAWILRS